MSITKLFLACSIALGSLTLSIAPAQAADAKAEAKKPAKAPVKKKTTAKKAAAGAAAAGAAGAAVAATAENAEEANEPNVDDTIVTEFDCELGNKVTIYTHANQDNHIALRWKKRLHRLTRVSTTTGAQRFENKLYGLIWIGIPAKGMLLDSKLNRQLANECKSPEQLQPAPAAAPVPAQG